MAIPKAIYIFNAIPIKIPIAFITRDWKIYPKIHLETQETMNSQDNTQQKQQCWRYHNTRVQTVLQSNSNKNSMVLAQKQTWRPWNRIDDPDMNSHSYAHLICDKGTKNQNHIKIPPHPC
jgi:hypothetical protein